MIVITVARKPMSRTAAENAAVHGTGGLNIDGCRIAPTGERLGGGDEIPSAIDKKQSGWSRPWMHDPEHAGNHATEMRARVEKATLMGRWPANVVLEHPPDCQNQGVIKIKGVPQVNDPEFSRNDRNRIYGHGLGGKGSLTGFGDSSGMEAVENWECVDGCPALELDKQSGVVVGSGGQRSGGTALGQGSGWNPHHNQVTTIVRLNDVGGASRYFKQVKK